MKTIFTTILCIASCLTWFFANAQVSTIKGRVTTSDGKPAPYVNITIKEANKTIISSEDGSFTIHADKECTCLIVVSYIGLKTQEKKVTIRNGENIVVN